MNILVIGSGGREHALCWSLLRSPKTHKIFMLPGNAGVLKSEKIECLNTSMEDHSNILNHCQQKNIDLVVIGPEKALADGLSDFLRSHNILVLGASKEASQIETSKAFAKKIMQEAKIPTANFQEFSSIEEAKSFLDKKEKHNDIVLKADGLAAGKGVIIPNNYDENIEALKKLFQIGDKVIIEDKLIGKEVSAFFLCDGEDFVELGHACDYKRIFDQDQGPNTGGMGAYSPAHWLEKTTQKQIQETIVSPLLKKMQEKNIPYQGFLFVGLMITNDGPKVIEFNARMGDPETQALLPLIQSDLLPWFKETAKNNLKEMIKVSELEKNKSTAVHVVMAASGYPGTMGKEIRKGDTITYPTRPGENFPNQSQTKLFWSGVKLDVKGNLKTSGGRVLGLTALGDSIEQARNQAYEKIQDISFQGAQYRKDIGL